MMKSRQCDWWALAYLAIALVGKFTNNGNPGSLIVCAVVYLVGAGIHKKLEEL